jgi:hypothetical protein
VTRQLQLLNLDRIRPSVTLNALCTDVIEDVTLCKGMLHKLHPKTRQRKLRCFELVRTTEGFFEIRCFDLSKKKGRGSTLGGEEHPTAVWQLNWTSTDALAITPITANASGGQTRKGSSRSSTDRMKAGAKGQTCVFSVTGLLNSKHLTQEQLLLEAPAQDDVARWMKTINDTMQQSMAREFGREFICGLKVLRIHMDGASMAVSAVISNAV